MSNSSGSAKQDKDARREAARAQAEQLRKSQAARERRSRNILLGVLGGVIVIVVAIGAFIFTQSQKTLLDDFDGAVPANTDNRGGISVGNVGTAGTVNEGAPVLQVYLDFMCPYCGQFEDANATDLAKLREAGDLTVQYHIVSNLDQASTTGFCSRMERRSIGSSGIDPAYSSVTSRNRVATRLRVRKTLSPEFPSRVMLVTTWNR